MHNFFSSAFYFILLFRFFLGEIKNISELHATPMFTLVISRATFTWQLLTQVMKEKKKKKIEQKWKRRNDFASGNDHSLSRFYFTSVTKGKQSEKNTTQKQVRVKNLWNFASLQIVCKRNSFKMDDSRFGILFFFCHRFFVSETTPIANGRELNSRRIV